MTKKYIMYKGIRNAITKERHRHRNSRNLYTFLYLGTMDINNMVLNWYIEEAGTKSSHLFHRLFISLNMLNVKN